MRIVKHRLAGKGLALLLTILILNPTIINSQFFKKLKDKAKEIQDAAQQLANTSKQVASTTQALKELKKTWTKDTSSNIKYQQIPDYRSKDEVTIEKKQNLVIENGDFKNVQWSPSTYFNNEVFASFIIGWASYKGLKEQDMGSSLGFSMANNTAMPVTFKWEIECNDKNYFNIDSGYITVYANQNIKFMPKIGWNFRALTKHQTAAPINIYFRLVDPNTGNKVEKVNTITLRSINDCIRFYNNKDYRYMYAAYVNEDHPEIDNILSDALKTKLVSSFEGYHASVDMQIAAIWRVLNERGFKYSSITANSSVNDDNPQIFSSQAIRTFDNAIKTNQANCVDGTVVFASILKKIGIEPIIITVPGHCFLGYYTDENRTQKAFLETTMLSSNSIINNPAKYLQLPQVKKFMQNLPGGTVLTDKNKCYYLEFLEAKASARDEYDENKNGLKPINEFVVSDLRKDIKPIPAYFD